MTMDENTHIVLAGVHSFSVESLFALLLGLLNVFADPNVPIESEDKVHTTGKRNEVRFQAANEDRRYRHQLAVSKLWEIV
jgi:hypothetical protein